MTSIKEKKELLVFDWKSVLDLWFTDKPFSDSHIKGKHINHSYSFEIIEKPLEKRVNYVFKVQVLNCITSRYIYVWSFGKAQSVTKKLFEQS